MTGEDRSGPPSSNEPADYKLKQQQLPAWQPALRAGTVLPTFFVIGVAFIPIGVGLLHLSGQVSRVVCSRFTICCSCQLSYAIKTQLKAPKDAY